jgi:hypothetical protein
LTVMSCHVSLIVRRRLEAGAEALADAVHAVRGVAADGAAVAAEQAEQCPAHSAEFFERVHVRRPRRKPAVPADTLADQAG